MNDAVLSSKSLEPLMEIVFNACLENGEFQQVLGIALEAERLDVIQKTLEKSQLAVPVLEYVKKLALDSISKLSFRNEVLQLLVRSYSQKENPDLLSIAECWVYLEDAASVVECFKSLLLAHENQENRLLMAYQIAFNLVSIAPLAFVKTVMKQLSAVSFEATTAQDASAALLAHVLSILSGDKPRELLLQFLYRNNNIDRYILQTTKSFVNAKSSHQHTGMTFSHAIMQCGTSNDDFLRNNMEFLGHASNWSKFSATSSLGLIHMGQVKDSKQLLSAYLPKEDPAAGSSSSATPSPYSEGGSLFALGLVHANHGDQEIMNYLQRQLAAANANEVVQHGAALGIGVCGLASRELETYEALKGVLFADNAVAGEAAALAMGLIMAGTCRAEYVEELIQYAHDTQHEKIIRALGLGISMMVYGLEDEADLVISHLLEDKDPILRYGGVYAVGMAYSGTSNNEKIKKLLHVAVSDTNDDVRRAAVIAIGFLCFKKPEQVPKIVKLLCESYNPHVRFGAAMALGISCASSGGTRVAKEAVELLEPLVADMSDFVRQAALVALSMIMIQATEMMDEKVSQIRSLYAKIIADKREDSMTKFGAMLGQGILDAGGRNLTIQLASSTFSGANPDDPSNPSSATLHPSMPAVLGLALFSQYWYWFPMTNFVGLAFAPTHLTCLTVDLRAPKFELLAAMKDQRLFAYPPSSKPVLQEKPVKREAVALSTTAKANARASTSKGDEKMMEETPSTSSSVSAASAMPETSSSSSAPIKERTKAEAAASKEVKRQIVVENGSRVLPAQRPFITFSSKRFSPIVPNLKYGFIMVKDVRKEGTAEEEVKYIEESSIDTSGAQEIAKELTAADKIPEAKDDDEEMSLEI